jgi:hypothetical protein
MTQPTIEEILRKYPPLKRFETNPDVVRQLYAELNPKRNLSDLEEGDYVNGVDVLIARVISTSSYLGCPVCYRKKEGVDEGTSFDCTDVKCNTQRVATRLTKWTLLGGDEMTKAILDFPPFAYKLEDGNQYVAKVVNIKGRVQKLTDQKENGKVVGKTPVIMVRDMKVVSDIRDAGTEPMEKTAEAESIPVTMAKAPPSPPIPPTPKPEVCTIPEPKLRAFNTWMGIMKTVTEAQLKSHVEGNLKLKMEDVLPLVSKTFLDSTQQTVYTLKPEPTH